MKPRTIKPLLILGLAGFLSAASAQTFTNVIFGTDFDSTGINDNKTGEWGYVYAGGNLGGAATGWAGSVTAGVGVTNSSAFDGMPDFTLTGADANYTNASAYTYSGTVIHFDFGAPLTPLTPTANPDSIIVSFDAKVAGLKPGVNSTLLEFKTDGAGVTLRTNGVDWIKLTGANSIVSSNFTHFEIPLSAMTLATGSFNDLTNAAILATVDSFIVEFRSLEETGTMQVDKMPVWGFDNDNQIIIDNFYLSQITGAAAIVLPKYEKTILDINFDDKPPGNTYSIVFRDGANAATVTTSTNATGGIGGSAALEGTADLTSWQASPPTGYSGFGVGAGQEISYPLTSSNKASYRIYWTAKVGGLLAGTDAVNGNASIQFLVPPGTLTPSNSAPAVVLELAPACTLSNVFQSFVFEGATCPIGIYNGGSQTLFNQYVKQVNQVQVQAQFNGGPDIGTVFGYDSDNTMIVDNIKVVELATGIPPVSVVAAGGQLKVYWADPYNVGTAKLQSSTNVAGPYQDVSGAASGASSPYTVPTGSSQKFFRTEWVH